MISAPRIPRILITSDDGIDSEGTKLLVKAAKPLADEVFIVAPKENQSGISQALTLHTPVAYKQRDERTWAVEGTPADCVILAQNLFMKEKKPSLLLSGVNAGLNIGHSALFSGTLGATLTGLMMGIPSIAFSQRYIKRGNVPWDTSRAIVPKMLTYFLSEGWQKDTCLSINIPAAPPEEIKSFCWTTLTDKYIKEIEVTPIEGPRLQKAAWFSFHNHEPTMENNDDFALISKNVVTVTALALNRSLEVVKPSVRFDSIQG